MKVLYATSIEFPSPRANRIQVIETARALRSLLGDGFTLGIGANKGETLPIPVVAFGSNLGSLRLAWRYLAYAKRQGITDFYCREEKLLFFLLLLNRFIFRLPLRFFYEIHHLVYLPAWWHRFILRHTDGVVSITSHMKDAVALSGYPSGRIAVVPDAVDLDAFGAKRTKEDARRALGLPEDRKIALYAGTIHVDEAWKGAGVFYESARYVGDDALCILVGGKPHYVEEFIAEHGTLPNASLLGMKPHEEIPLYLAAADVLVLPNTAKTEISRISTSPMKLFEYMASERPIVASDIPSLREVLDEERALFVAPDDPEALGAGIKALFDDSPRAARLAGEARRCVERYTWEGRARAIMSFIEHE